MFQLKPLSESCLAGSKNKEGASLAGVMCLKAKEVADAAEDVSQAPNHGGGNEDLFNVLGSDMI